MVAAPTNRVTVNRGAQSLGLPMRRRGALARALGAGRVAAAGRIARQADSVRAENVLGEFIAPPPRRRGWRQAPVAEIACDPYWRRRRNRPRWCISVSRRGPCRGGLEAKPNRSPSRPNAAAAQDESARQFEVEKPAQAPLAERLEIEGAPVMGASPGRTRRRVPAGHVERSVRAGQIEDGDVNLVGSSGSIERAWGARHFGDLSFPKRLRAVRVETDMRRMD